MANVTDIIEYYVNLLIIQYNIQPKARATIELFAQTFLASGIYFDVQNGYNIDTAVGAQLDVLGKYEGVDRIYQSPDLTGYFSTIDYSQVASPPSQLGFTNYSDYPLPAGNVLIYSDLIGGNAQLNDDNFRILIKLAIATNYSNFSRKSIDDNMFAIFGETVIPSSLGNMVMWYFVPTTLTALMTAALQKGLLPSPMGVRNGGLIERNVPFFGMIDYSHAASGIFSSDISGFSTYANYGTTSGNMLTYDAIIH